MSESTLEKDDSPETGEKEVTVGATGQELREHREALGANLGDISDMLCIRRDFLEALEAGKYESLPGEAYAVGFVRSYAKYLGLDADAMARQFKVELSGERPTARLDFLAPAAESRVPTAAIVFVAVLLLIAIYGLWYFLNARDVSVSDMVPEIPAHLAGTAVPTTPPPAANADTTSTAAPASAPAEPAKESVPSEPAAAEAPPATAGDAPAVQAPEVGAASEPPKPAGSDATAAPDTPTQMPTTDAGTAPSADPAAQAEVKPAAPESPALSVGGPAPQPAAVAPQNDAAAETQAAPEADMPLSSPLPPTRRPAERAPASDQGADRGQDGQQDQRLASAASPQPAASPPGPADKLAPSRIVLRAKDDSWVEVRTASGDLVISRVMTQGETYLVPPRPGLTLTTGNAGGLEILVDGQALPSLGGTGKVRRDIALDPERLKSRFAGQSR